MVLVPVELVVWRGIQKEKSKQISKYLTDCSAGYQEEIAVYHKRDYWEMEGGSETTTLESRMLIEVSLR